MKKKVLSYLLLTIFIVYLVVYIKNHASDFEALLHISPIYLVAVAALHLSGIFLNGLFVKYTILPFKKTIGAGESFFVSLFSTMGNYFLPVGAGTGMKAVYLKKKFQLAYADFVATLSGNYIVVFLINSLFGLIALFILRSSGTNAQFKVLFIMLGGIFMSMLMLATYGFPKFLINWFSTTKFLKKLSAAVAQVLRGWNIIISHKGLLIKLILITLMNFVITMTMTQIIATSVGFSVSFWALVLYTALGAVSFLLNVTPGSIGIREAIFIFSSAVLGISISQVLSISIVQNGVLFFVLIFSWVLVQIPYLKKRLVPIEVQ